MALPAIIGAALRGLVSGGRAVGGAAARSGVKNTALEGMAGKAGDAEKMIKRLGTGMGQMKDKIGHSIQAMEGWSGKFVGYMAAAATAVDRMAKPIQQFVAIANPAKAKMFQMAMDDAYGVVGRQLIPVMDAFTRTARKVGDTMAKFEPITEPLISSLENLVDKIGTGLSESIEELAPQIMSATELLMVFADAVAWVAKNAAAGVKILKYASPIGLLAEAFSGNDARKKLDKNGTSMGAAAREARFIAPKTIADEAIKASMMIGATPKETNAEKLQREANGYLKKIAEKSDGKTDDKPNGSPSSQRSTSSRSDDSRRYMTG